MCRIEPHRTERRPHPLLVALMVASNAFLLLCMVGLGVAALGDRTSPSNSQTSQKAVKAYLASKMPDYRYRIREWYPPMPLAGEASATADETSESAADGGVAQRVKIVFYGPHGAKQLDTVYWVRDGKVTRRTEADHPDFVRDL
jgi:hypothetical protein